MSEHGMVHSIGTPGVTWQQYSTWPDYLLILHAHSSCSSCMMRPTENPNCFYVALGGNINHEKLESDKEEYFKAIRAATDRQDLQFGHLRWISNWRPNIRMVNKFREGRGFVAGGVHIRRPRIDSTNHPAQTPRTSTAPLVAKASTLVFRTRCVISCLSLVFIASNMIFVVQPSMETRPRRERLGRPCTA